MGRISYNKVKCKGRYDMKRFEFILEYKGENFVTKEFISSSIGEAWQAFGHWLTTVRAYADIDLLIGVKAVIER